VKKALFTFFFLSLLTNPLCKSEELLDIRFATDWRAQAEQGGFYQALALGLYEEKGLRVKIIQGNASVNIPRLLAFGEVDFGIGSNSFIPLNMVANGLPGKAVMASFQKDPQIIMTHPSSSVEIIEDMQNKPIMISEASIGAFWLWLKSKYSFSDNQIRKKTFSLAPFIINKEAIQQGYLTSEPYLVEKELGRSPKIFLLADYGYPSYGAMILASEEIIKKRPNAVKDFVEASIEGWKSYIYDNPYKGNQLIMRENREMTEEILLQAIEKIRQYNLISNDTLKRDVGLMENKIWSDFFKIMSENGVYEKDLNWEDAFTLDFLNEDNN
tara:strand:+ start:137 stop:1117 length:981 start_codon:yes stop_codon:yes gene_type:complete